MSNRVEVPMAELSELLLDSLARGQEATLPITGVSMLPFLQPERDSVVLTSAASVPLRRGDVVLFRRENGQYVLHRIHNMPKPHSNRYAMLGDAQREVESVSPLQILAVATAFEVKGRRVSAENTAYRCRVVLWRLLLPLRRILMAIWRRAARR